MGYSVYKCSKSLLKFHYDPIIYLQKENVLKDVSIKKFKH